MADERARPSAVALTWGVAVGAAAVTVAVVALPFVQLAYRAPALHVALETVNAVIALMVAFLVVGRYRQGRRVQDLLLVLALSTVAVANLVLTAVPTALAITEDTELSRWAPLAVRLVGTLLLVAAAVTPSTAFVGRRGAARPVAAVLLAVLVLSVVGIALGGRLPPVVDPAVDLDDASRPVLAGHPVAVVVQALGGVLYAVAAVAFTRRAQRDGDVLLRWVGAGCVLAAFARVHYLLFPSLYSDFVYTGDLLRLGFYLLLLVGAAREIETYWAARTRAAVLEDRRRLARDLHDGLTQELTYIYSQSRQLTSRPADPDVVQRINGAAARAIDEARTAIAALTRTTSPCFSDVLREAVDGLASRYDARAVVEVPDDLELPPDRADAVLRIVGEAFRNAVRHGKARGVTVRLTDRPFTLSVDDDGQGFDVQASKDRGGFGLTSMRERAEGLGGRLEISSEPGRGTRVEVLWA